MTNFHKLSIFLFIILISSIFLCCEKDSDPCKTCGIDSTIKKFDFTITGNLREGCQSNYGSHKLLEFHIFYNTEDSLAGTTQTDDKGDFSFTYSKILPGDFWLTAQWSSLLRIIVREDSTIFFLAGLKNLSDLHLTLNDSLDMAIVLKKGAIDFSSVDSVFYWFGNNRRLEPAIVYKIGGPITTDQIITIHGPWRYVTYYYSDTTPALNLYWGFRHSGSWATSSNFEAISYKEFCQEKTDTLIINLQ